MAEEFDYGAVVLMDALGFKGIWQQPHTLEMVLHRLRVVEEIFEEAKRAYAVQIAQHIGFRLKVSFLSDTIAIACHQEPLAGRVVNSGGMVAIALGLAGFACHAGAADRRKGEHVPVPLAYRGAIASGEMHVGDRYVVGPAIDEAATWMNRAQAAMVMLAPSALDVFQPAQAPAYAIRWFVPLETGQSFETWVSSPFAHDDGPAETKWEIAEEILDTFDRPSAPEKVRTVYKPNTETFLRAALAEWLRAARQAPSA